MGEEGMEMGEKEIIYLSLHFHHQNDFCIKMGSDGSHFNVSLIVRDKVSGQCPQTTIFEETGGPKQIQTKIPLLTSMMPYRQAKPAHKGTGLDSYSERRFPAPSSKLRQNWLRH